MVAMVSWFKGQGNWVDRQVCCGPLQFYLQTLPMKVLPILVPKLLYCYCHELLSVCTA